MFLNLISDFLQNFSKYQTLINYFQNFPNYIKLRKKIYNFLWLNFDILKQKFRLTVT